MQLGLKQNMNIKQAHHKNSNKKKEPEEGYMNLSELGLESNKIWSELVWNGVRYTSLIANETKPADYFVRMKNNKCGKIVLFAYQMDGKILVLNTYAEKIENYHWIETEQNDQYEVFKCCEIQEKLLCFKTGTIEYITREPNRYSRAST